MSPQLINEIRDLNLSFLLLAQQLIRKDRVAAMARLGVTRAVAEQIAQLSPQQLMRVAARNLVLCSLKLDDPMVLGLLADSHMPAGAAPAPKPARAGSAHEAHVAANID